MSMAFRLCDIHGTKRPTRLPMARHVGLKSYLSVSLFRDSQSVHYSPSCAGSNVKSRTTPRAILSLPPEARGEFRRT